MFSFFIFAVPVDGRLGVHFYYGLSSGLGPAQKLPRSDRRSGWRLRFNVVASPVAAKQKLPRWSVISPR